MRLSKSVLKQDRVLEKVLEFRPPKFELGAPEQALEYLNKKKGSDFRMNEAIRVQTGVKDIEAASHEEMIEQRVLERLKEVQETAYQEAYQLGLEEGRKEAFNKADLEIEENIQNLNQLIATIKNLKKDLLQFNEAHLIKLLFHMAERLAGFEIKQNPEAIVSVMKNAIELAQVDEEMTVQIAASQVEFLETLKKETKRELEFLSKVKLVGVDNIAEGGCVIETNYGEIDARIEERVKKLWETLAENLYTVKNKVSGS